MKKIFALVSRSENCGQTPGGPKAATALLLILALAFGPAALAQNVSNGPVTKKTSGASINDLNEDLNIGSGRTATVKSGGTLNASAGTITLADGQLGWSKVSKDGSSLAHLATRNFADLQGKPTTLAGYGIVLAPADIQAASAPFTNPRAPRGGLAFDGTANTRVTATLTNQNIGTDAFSVAVMVKVPLLTGTQHNILSLTSSQSTITQAASIQMDYGPDGKLRVYVYGATTSDYFGSTFASATYGIGAYAGKTVLLTLARTSAGAIELRINGGADIWANRAADSGGSVPTAAQSITSTYLALGFGSASVSSTLTIYFASLYNLALSAADVLEIYELGGAVPERFKFGSQVGIISGSDSDMSSSTGNWAIANGFTALDVNSTVAGKLYMLTSASGLQRIGWTGVGTVSMQANRKYRVSAKLRLVSGTADSINLGNSNTVGGGGTIVTATPTGTETTVSGIVGGEAVNTTRPLQFYISSASNAAGYSVDDVTLVQLGAICHLDGDSDGIGYQWHDQSTNKLDAVLTTTGVTWTKPQRRGYVRGTLTWAGTHEGKTFLVQRCLPDGAIIDRITTKATAASTGSGLSIPDAPVTRTFVALNAFTTAKKIHALANQIPVSNGNNENTLLVDPDSANYTGSIEVEVQYSVTEGTP